MKILSAVCLILGCFLGAGFVSGREVAYYFSRFGEMSYLPCIVCGVLFFILTMFFFIISSKVSNTSEFFSMYFKKCATVVEWLFAICIVIFIGSMIAGTSALADCLGYNKLVFVMFTMILTFLVVNKNIQGISNINTILVPILILVLCLTIRNGEYPFSSSNEPILSMFYGAAYVFINIVSLGLIIIEIGYKYTFKEKVIVSIISTTIIVGLLLGINYSIISNNLVDAVMPNLVLSRSNFLLYFVMQIAVYLGLFTTLISNTFLLSRFVNKYIRDKRLSIIFCLLMGLLISLCGFNNIVGFVYIFIGIVGVVIVVGGAKKRV